MSVLRQVGRAVRRAPSGAFHRGGGALVLAVAGAASSLLFGCAHGGSGTNQSYGTSGDDSGAGDPGAADAAIGVSSGGGGEAGAIGATDATSPGVEAGSGTDAWTSGEGGPPAPSVVSKQQVCKLINGQSEGDPTANQAPSLADLNGTELGIPIDVVGELYFFFGDTHGKAIWLPGQSLPDAVGYSLDPATALAATPGMLCNDLRFVTLSPGSSYGPTVDSTIVADFAAMAMSAPSGQMVTTYVHNPSGDSAGWWPNLPGTSEVPSGGFSYGGDAYLFYTTVAAPNDTTMKASYLARWKAPSTQTIPTLDVLYSVDERFDSSGPLHGDFVNVSAETSGTYVYLFGTGDFRKSPVRLARKALTSLGTPGGIELFDASSGTWGTSQGAPIVSTPGYGETSVRFFSAINRWMMLAVDFDGHTQVVARFADQPEGPWSGPVVVEDMMDPTFMLQYCCGTSCTGQQMIYCSRSALYGAFLLPELTVQKDGSFTVGYTLSTGDPFDVVLMQVTFSA